MAEVRRQEILERYRLKLNEYQRWLAEFPEITLVLDNLAAEAEGKESLSASYPPPESGPWTVSGLRDVIRRRNAAPELLAALKHARGCGLLSPERDSLTMIDAAIAKAMNEASLQIEADEPPEMHHHAERPADEIDAGLFSGDAFEDAGARARLRWYMARWERQLRRIEQSEKVDQSS